MLVFRHRDIVLVSLGLQIIEKLSSSGSVGWVDLQHGLDHGGQRFGKIVPYFLIRPFDNFLVQPVHVFGSEWGFKSSHLVNDAAERPDVGFGVIGLILPYLGTGIVRGSGLRVEQSIFSYFRHIHVA